MLEYCWLNLSHGHEEEAEEYEIPTPLLLHCTISDIGNHYLILLQKKYCPLFNDILTPPLCDAHRNCLLLKVGQIANTPFPPPLPSPWPSSSGSCSALNRASSGV